MVVLGEDLTEFNLVTSVGVGQKFRSLESSYYSALEKIEEERLITVELETAESVSGLSGCLNRIFMCSYMSLAKQAHIIVMLEFFLSFFLSFKIKKAIIHKLFSRF